MHSVKEFSRAGFLLILSAWFWTGVNRTHGASLPTGFFETELGGYWEGAVGITFDSIGTMYQWDRHGRVWIVENGVRQQPPLIDISEEVGNWRDHGLLGFALHPAFRQNGYIYLLYGVDHHHLMNFGTANYNASANEYNQASISRLTRYTARASDNFRSVDPASRTIFIGDSHTNGIPILFYTHGIGTLFFGTDGTLLLSTGDGAGLSDPGNDPESYYIQGLNEGIIQPRENVGAFRSQMVNSYNGKILRLDPITGDGLPSNPFYDPAAPRSARSRVWTVGLRNPFRVTLRPGSGSANPNDGQPGVIYVGDVGYFTWEKMSVVTGPGQNLGWPIYEGLEECSSYVGDDPLNMDAPNPLFGVNGCSKQYFSFRDLFKAASLAAPSWPNPCNPSQQIPSSIPRFVHNRPVLDWHHGSGPSRVGTFVGNDPAVVNLGEAGSAATGPQFGGNCSIAGLWYTGNHFPTQYRNTYFHIDADGGWIRNFIFNTNNQLISVQNFASGVAGVVSIVPDPADGGFYTINVYNGIRKISYGGNSPPNANATVNVNYGPAPLAVEFSSAGSSDPEGVPLTYEWNFGDGSPINTSANPAHIFNAPSGGPTNYHVTLTVSDGVLSDNTTLEVSVNNSPPAVVIASPAPGTKYPLTHEVVYDLIANVVDAESNDDQLRYEWLVALYHNNHNHPEPIDTNHVTTALVTPIGCDADTYWYRFTLTVRDPAGLASTTYVDVYPDCTNRPPTISDIPNQSILQGGAAGPVPLTVGDADTPPGDLVLSATSSNPALVSPANIVFGGTGANRTISLTPEPDALGAATITVTVSDGTLTATDTFILAVNSTSAPTYLFSEGFEGTGYENAGWSESGAVNEDYATALDGTHALNVSGNQLVWHFFDFTSNSVNLYLQARWNTWAPYKSFITFDDGAWNVMAEVYGNFNTFLLTHGGVEDNGTRNITANTTYHLWVEWTRGTANNGTMKLFVSTTPTKPATPDALINTGAGGIIRRMTFGSTVGGPNLVVDRILMDDVEIGSDPAGGGGSAQPPTISNIANQTIGEGAATAAIPFAVSDPDTPVGSLMVSGVSGNTALVPTSNIVFGGSGANRTVTVTPAAGQFGTATITVTVSDGSLTAIDSFNLVVTPAVNTPPVISDISDRVTDEDTPTGAIAFTVGDGESAPGSLVVSGSSSNPSLVPNAGIVFGGAGVNRTVNVIPVANQSGAATITVTVSDGGLSTNATFEVAVAAVNDGPTISSLADQTIEQDTPAGPFSFTVGDLETTAGALTVSGTSSNPTLVTDANIAFGGVGANRTVTVTPVAGQIGNGTITVTVSDSTLTATETFALTVTSTNAPTFLFTEGFEGPGYENTGWTESGAANEDYATALEGSHSLNVSGTQLAWHGFDQPSQFYMYLQARWNAWPHYKSFITFDDGAWNVMAEVFTDFQRFLLTHGGAQVYGTTTTAVDTTYHLWVEWTKGAGNNGTLKLFVSTTGIKPAAPDAFITTGTGGAIKRITFGATVPGQNLVVDKILVDDVAIGSNPGGGGAPANQPPTISDVANQAIPEGGTTGGLSFTVGDPESPPGSLTVSGASSNPTLIPNANIVFGGNGANRTVTVTPAAAQSGSATITVTVSDGSLSAVDTFGVLVTPAVNTAPTIADIGDRTTNEDVSTGPIAFTVDDAETGPGSLILSGSSSNPSLVLNGGIVFGGSGANRTITVNPLPNQFGSSTITVTVSDGSLTAVDTFDLTVSPVNDAPTISNVTDQSIDQDSATAALSFVIGDLESVPGTLAVTGSSSNPTLVPEANIAFGGSGANRTVTVTPALGMIGSATITLGVSDGVLAATDTFLLIVNSTSAPVYLFAESFEGPGFENAGWSESGAVNEDYTTTVLEGSQSANVSGTQLLWHSFNYPTQFNLYLRARWNTWAPYKSFLTFCDNFWNVAAEVHADFNVLQLSHGNVIRNGTTQIGANTTYHIWVEFVRGTGNNGTMKLFVSTDGVKPAVPDNQITTGTGGLIERIIFGSTVGAPNLIVDQLLVDDAPIGSNPGGGGNSSPTISNIASVTINEGGATGALPFTIGDVETAVASLSVTGTSSDPALVPNANIVFGGSGANRTVTVTPTAGTSGTATVTVTVSDGSLSANDTFDVIVTPAVNTAPTISDIADRSIDEDSGTGAISFTIGDGESTATSLTVTGVSSNPSVVPNANIAFGGAGTNRTVTITPAANQFGVATITVTVSDGALTSNDAFEVTVAPVDDSPMITSIADQTIDQATAAGPLSFAISDPETPAGTLLVSGASSNPVLVPNGNIVFGGAGASRAVTVTPLAGEIGAATITVTVSDGALSASEVFQLTVNATNAPTYLFTEGFEGPGYENPGWTKSGAVNEDYTAAALSGSQSMNISGTQLTWRPFDYPDSFNLYLRARWNVFTGYKSFISFDDNFWNITTEVYANYPGLMLTHGNTLVNGTTAIAANTTYHLWVEWTRGTGADGTMKLFMSTTGIKPAVPEIEIADGSGAAVRRIIFGTTVTGPDVIIDQMLVDDVPIGDQQDVNPAPAFIGELQGHAAPTIELLSRKTGSMFLRVNGAPDSLYAIEASEDLSKWTALGEVADSSGISYFLDTTAGAHRCRFYRAVLKQ